MFFAIILNSRACFRAGVFAVLHDNFAIYNHMLEAYLKRI